MQEGTFKFNVGDDVNTYFPWACHMSALDGSLTGLLHANLQALIMQYDKGAKLKQQEIDILAFAPTADRAFGIFLLKVLLIGPSDAIANNSNPWKINFK